MSKKDYAVRIDLGRTYKIVDGLAAGDIPALDITQDIMREQIRREISDNMQTALCVSPSLSEEPEGLTRDKLLEALDLIGEKPEPVADLIKCRRPRDIAVLYPDDVTTVKGGPKDLDEYFFCGVPIKPHPWIPENVIAFFLNGELVAMDSLNLSKAAETFNQ